MGLHFREDIMNEEFEYGDPAITEAMGKTNYSVTASFEFQRDLRDSGKPTRKDFEAQDRCIDRENGLDCGCLICGRD
jgi:hypothetical protein